MNGIRIIIPPNFATNEANEFRKNLINLISKDEKNFEIDFSECTFIDVTGLGVLISFHKRCMKLNRSFKIISIKNKDVMKIFELTRLNKIFEIGR
jgi:anti-sigma B factor antagonist